LPQSCILTIGSIAALKAMIINMQLTGQQAAAYRYAAANLSG